MTIQHEQRTQQFELQKKSAEQEIGTKQALQSMQEKKYNVENVVNKKTDTAMGKVEQAVRQIHVLGDTLQTIIQQAQQTQHVLDQLLKVSTAKRVRKPIRRKDGRIERVEEELEPEAIAS